MNISTLLKHNYKDAELFENIVNDLNRIEQKPKNAITNNCDY